MNWRRLLGVAVPLGVVLFALGFIVGLEVRRGPNWRLELDAYVEARATTSETVMVDQVTRARRPWNFRPEMGRPADVGALTRPFPPQAVRCVLLVRSRPALDGPHQDLSEEVLYLVRHSDALYHVEWVAYEGPEEPFGPQLKADLASIGCDLVLE